MLGLSVPVTRSVRSPSRPVDVTRLEPDMEKLGELYWLGYSDAMERLGEVRAYLGVDGPEATA